MGTKVILVNKKVNLEEKKIITEIKSLFRVPPKM